jgi:hypothetical protein
MINNEFKTITYESEKELTLRADFFDLFKKCPIPSSELMENLGLFIKRQDLSQILFMSELYKQIINVHGVVFEFGVRWGKNLALFESLRGMYEPFNKSRKIVGFDTFEGFPSVHDKDGQSEIISKGSFTVAKGYEKYLSQILQYHEQESPVSHIKSFELVKGDASQSIINYLDDHPETIVALAYFDLDIYEPTLKCLEAIKDRLVKGSVIGFDELCCKEFPGETLAVKEALNLEKIKLIRDPNGGHSSYTVIE